MGLGGSIRYKKGINQYTQRQMQHRVSRMWLQLKCKKGFDILLTHSPAAGINDGFDSVHQGFTVFNELLDTYHPAYLFTVTYIRIIRQTSCGNSSTTKQRLLTDMNVILLMFNNKIK